MKTLYSDPYEFNSIEHLIDSIIEVPDQKRNDSYYFSYKVEFYLNQNNQLFAKVTFKIENPPSQYFLFTIKIARMPKKFKTISLHFPFDISEMHSSSKDLCLNLTPRDFDDTTRFLVSFAHCFYQSHLSGLQPVYMTCYMNSVLQILYHIPEFRNIIYSIPNNSTGVFNQLIQLFRFMENPGTNPPSNFLLTKSFGWTEEDLSIQQDAQEFLCVFLDYIKNHLDQKDLFEKFWRLFYATQFQESKETHLLTIPVHESRTLLKALNNAMYPSEPRFPELMTLMRLYHSLKKLITACQNDPGMPTEYPIVALAILNRDTSDNDQFINSLRDILSHLEKTDDVPYECAKFQKALSRFINYDLQESSDSEHSFSPEIYHLHTALNSIVNSNENPPNLTNLFIHFFYYEEIIQFHADKRNYFAKLPDIIIFQLLSAYTERSKPIQYELELSMAKYVHPNFDYKKQEIQQDKNHKYELISVVIHQGRASGGHYYSICRTTDNENFWFKFDEQTVSLAKLEDALRKIDPVPITKSSSANMTRIASPSHNIPITRSYSTPTFPQSSPYLLVYCNKNKLKQIMKPKQNEESQSVLHQRIIPRIDNNIIYVMTIQDIEHLFANCRFCFCRCNIFSMAKIKIEKSKINTIDDLYASVSQQYENQEHKFVLWRCISGFNPETAMVINDFGSGQTREILDKPTFLFLQEIESDESIFTFENNSVPKCNVFSCLFFVFFFDPKKLSITFIGLCEAQTNAMVQSVYNPIRNLLIKKGIIDKSNYEELLLFAERKCDGIVQLSDSSTFQYQLKKPGYNILYVQFKDDCDIDFSLFNLNYDDAKSFNSLSHVEAPSLIDNFLLMKEKSINITFHRLSTNDHLTLRVPRNITNITMSNILYEYFHDLELQLKENNSNYKYIDDVVLLALQPISYLRDSIIDQYKASRHPPESTDEQPPQIDFNQYLVKKDNVQCFFFQSVISSYSSPKAITFDSIISNNRGTNHINVYFDFFPSITKPLNTQRVEISEDGILPSQRFQIIIPSGDSLNKFEQRVLTYQDVAQLIGIQPGNLNTSSNRDGEYRIVMISQGKITKIVQPTDNYHRAGLNTCIIRYEKIPHDQLWVHQMCDQNIQDYDGLLRVIYAVKEQNNVVPFGIPFYIAITQEDNFESVTQRICAKNMLTFLPEGSQFEFLLADSFCHVVNDIPPLFGDFSRSGYLCVIVKESVSMKDALLMQKYETKFVGLKIYA